MRTLYLFISLSVHLLVLVPLYFLNTQKNIPLNANSVFIEVRELAPIKEVGIATSEKAQENKTETAKPTSKVSSSNVSSPTEGKSEIEIRPVYPLLSRKLGEEGEATFILNLEKDGSVLLARLEKSSGFDRLDEAARDALMKAKFNTGEEKNEKRFSVVFRLKNKP